MLFESGLDQRGQSGIRNHHRHPPFWAWREQLTDLADSHDELVQQAAAFSGSRQQYRMSGQRIPWAKTDLLSDELWIRAAGHPPTNSIVPIYIRG